MDIGFFTGISDDMDLWGGGSNDVDMWQSNSGNVINNECMTNAFNNAFNTNKVNLLCTKLF